uniref:Adenine DNA glycosylase-like n=1 Tax=Phallusia mammillata TaxID=59560 RepID=A0A6F9DLB4_9ASCI|nr:adenine DNA glycosylase-like [Phallusia mammillata]
MLFKTAMDFNHGAEIEICDIVSEKQKSFLKRLQPQKDQLEMQTAAVGNVCQKAHDEYVERWKNLQQLERTITSEMEQLWNQQSEYNANRDELKKAVEELKEKIAKLNEQLKSQQAKQMNMKDEIQQINNALIDLARTLIAENPREKFMDQLLTNITKIKWSDCIDQSNESIKGVVVQSSQHHKKFQFNPHQQSAKTICTEIWELMTECDNFLK